jgi:hypothetical protein
MNFLFFLISLGVGSQMISSAAHKQLPEAAHQDMHHGSVALTS